MYLEKFRLNDRTALVTGGGRGIGAEIASALAEAGAQVVIVDIDGASAEQTAARLSAAGNRAHHRQADLTSITDVETLADNVAQTIGDIDILVNNAGIVVVMDLFEYHHDELDGKAEASEGGIHDHDPFDVPCATRGSSVLV